MSESIKFLSLITLKWKGLILTGKYITENKDYLIVKLDNGYNLTFRKGTIQILNIESPSETGIENHGINPENKTNPAVKIIGTGGTIASYIDYKTGAVKPLRDFQRILFSDEELESIGRIEDEILFNIFSEDMEPEHWLKMAKRAYELTNDGTGVVFAHGTDTMAFSSSAISFLIENQRAPIVFTGSQRSSDRPSSDAFFNLRGAIKLALTDIGEVSVVMHHGISDDLLSIHRGVRVRKMHTSRRDAFKSINDEEIGTIDKNMKINFGRYKRIDPKVETILHDKFNKKISLIFYYPGMDMEIFLKQLEDMDGIIIAGTGLGHINNKFIDHIKQYTENKIVGITSQCLYGSVNLNVYSTGRNLLNAGVIPLGDMLPETAFVKLGFLLGNYDFQRAKLLLTKNLRGEISDRRKY